MRLPAMAMACSVLLGCAQQPTAVAPVPATTPLASDPQQCLSQVECTTKTSRTLLFVFDYAAAGGALVQRQERLLFTPADAPRGEWPAIYIRLAEPMSGRFDFNAECQVPRCRYSAAQLLQVYRDYLAGQPGDLSKPAGK
ncbi:conserved exported hypothetical protein [Pseudomonas sp. 8AS]|uniref:hypothetical protein n=1 Tax=Pseudomonas sp. 8AS TaxID=2653163 RepID=UPI0012F17C53|nr:hypothetical protein [Pseudomonas sp. 8AS]VXB18041.1 conserved exported hypothetical protein [Pseudomonas sp. 8AS]